MIASLWRRLVAFGFRLLYNEMAFTYDAVSYVVSLGDWRAWQLAALHFLPPAPAAVLELAHGTGHLQARLLADGYHAVGLDLSRAMGQITRRRLAQARLPVRLARGRGEALPFASVRFDAIVCTFPTRFIFEPATLSECQRVLKPDGVLVVVLNGVLTRKGVVERLIDRAYAATGQHTTGYDQVVSWVEQQGYHAQLERTASPRGCAEVLVARPANLA
ncbi:MAG: class I SAM-dependent methyltransferase [Anaerolineae bacterium]